jgi:hypothetical protein
MIFAATIAATRRVTLPPAPAQRALPPLPREAQAQLALTELFPHLRAAADQALRELFPGLRLPQA